MTRLGFLIAVVSSSIWISSLNALDRKDYEMCLNSENLETNPGKVDIYYKKCKPWQDYSCCKSNSSLRWPIHDKFDVFEVGLCETLSEECMKHFIQFFCFYGCEPFLRPWTVLKHGRPDAYDVPLCASECQSWWSACREEWTCARNWVRDFGWEEKEGKVHNVCKQQCKRFDHVFEGAEDFCETVWDHSWKYTDDSEPCIKMWFDASDGNPNQLVAEWYAERKKTVHAVESGAVATGHHRLVTGCCGLLVVVTAQLAVAV